MNEIRKYRVEPGKKLRLSRYESDDTSGAPGGKAKGKEELVALSARLDELQELLYANHDRKLLVILQGMDTSGKDGTIRHVFDNVLIETLEKMKLKAPKPEDDLESIVVE